MCSAFSFSPFCSLSLSLSFPFFDFLPSGDFLGAVDVEAIGCGVGRDGLGRGWLERTGDWAGVVRERDMGEVLSVDGAWRCP
jgi:hypothetical protein